MANQKPEKVVLAYSGGLDTSVILPWLKETYDCEVIAFVADALDNVIRGMQDFEEKLGEPLLAAVPLVDLKKQPGQSAAHAFDNAEEHGFREAIRTIRTGITLSTLDDPHEVIMVTSSVSGDGKSTVAANIAIAFGQMGRTLLIDCDMRRPSLAEEFGLPKTQPGLAELMAGSAKLSEAVLERVDERIHLLCAGAVPPNPLEMLASDRFRAMIDQLQGLYDHVVIDCPPTLPVSDSTVISTVSDAIVYVVKAGATTTKQAQQGLKTLRGVNGHVVGCVLNAVDVKKAARYDSGYGYYESYA